MTPERKQRIHSVLSKRQPDLTVVADKIVKERNLAAIVRTCDAIGVPDLHSVGHPSEYRSYRGTSASAQKYVSVTHHDSVQTITSDLRSQGFQVVAAHLSPRAIDYREIDYTKATALVMGAEIEGVSDQALAHCDHHIVIPMMGMVESFNVSVACALILSEAQRQRLNANMYAQTRLDEAEYERLFFRWGYPKLAEFCDERGLPYPALDENGDLVADKTMHCGEAQT